MLKAIPKNCRVIALDVQGSSWSTEQLSAKLAEWMAAGPDLALLVGGPEGLAPACLARSEGRWSLSALTLPHPLVRVVVAEQLYRAWSLHAKSPLSPGGLMDPLIYLASRSPRRQQLLEQIGVPHRLLDVAVDETPIPGESPEDYVVRLALAKAVTGHAERVQRADLPVLAADTAVVLDDKILGKPRHRLDGLAMLLSLSDRTHRVCTGVALIGSQADVRLDVSAVTFRRISAREAEAYWASGEPQDKAGGYAYPGPGGRVCQGAAGQLLRCDGIAAVRNRGTAARCRYRPAVPAWQVTRPHGADKGLPSGSVRVDLIWLERVLPLR